MNTDIRLFTNEDMKTTGKIIQNVRKKKGFKSIDFVDIIGIGKEQFSRIENGNVPCKVEYMCVIVQYLVDIDDENCKSFVQQMENNDYANIFKN